MMNNQNARVLRILKEQGYISRNQCLSMYPAITRLGARIADLKERGHTFRTESKHGDYFYILTTPKRTRTLTLEDGRIISQTEYAV